MTTLIVENHLLVQELLIKVCSSHLGLGDIFAVGTAELARSSLEKASYNLLIINIFLPDADGLDLIFEALRITPNLKVLVLSPHCNEFTVFRLFGSPIHGFVDQSTQTVRELCFALDAVIAGKIYYSPSMETVIRRIHKDPGCFSKILSDREIVVLRQLGRGDTDERIGRDLDISPATAKWHRKQIMKKLRLHSHPELIVYANLNGFSRLM